MSSISRYSQYDSIAPVYNNRDNNKTIIPILDKLLLQNLPEEAKILDLGCGAGSLMSALIEKGYQATGIDGSEAMLAKARKDTPDGFYILEDLRSFKVTPSFHAAISVFVLLHMMTLEDITRVFQNTYNALLEDGWFVFEIEDEEVYKVDSPIEDTTDFTDDYAQIMRIKCDTDNKTAQIYSIVFQLIEGKWQRSDTVLSKRAFTQSEIQPALEKIGFTIAGIYDAERDFALRGMAGTKVYVCRKLQKK